MDADAQSGTAALPMTSPGAPENQTIGPELGDLDAQAIEELRSEVAKWQERVPKLAAALRERTDELDAAREEIRSLKFSSPGPGANVEDADARLAARNELIAELEAKVGELTAKHRDAASELHTVQFDLEEASENAQGWKDKWQSVTGALDEAVQAKTKEGSAYNEARTRWEAEQTELERHFASEREQLQCEVDSLRNRNENLLETTELANKQIEALGEELNSLMQQSTAAREASASTDAKITSLELALAEAQEQARHSDSLRDGEVSERQRAVEAQESLQVEHARIVEQQADDRAQLARVQAEFEAVQAQLEARSEALLSVESEMAEQLSTAREQMQAAQARQSEIDDELREARERLSRQDEETEAAHQVLVGERDEARAQAERARDEMESALADVTEAQRESTQARERVHERESAAREQSDALASAHAETERVRAESQSENEQIRARLDVEVERVRVELEGATEQRIIELGSAREVAEAHLEAARAEAAGLADRNTGLEIQLEEQTRAMQAAQDELAQVQRANQDELARARSEAQEQIEQANSAGESDKRKLDQTVATLTEERDALSQARAELENDLQEAQAKVEEQRVALEHYNEVDVQALIGSNEELQSEVARLDACLSQAQEQTQKLESERRALNDSLGTVSAEQEKIKAQLEERSALVRELETERQENRSQLQSISSSSEEHARALGEAEHKVKTFKEHAASLEEKLTAQQDLMVELETEMSEQQSELNTLAAEHSKRSQQQDRKHAETLKVVNDELAKTERELALLRADLGQAQASSAKNAASDAELDELRGQLRETESVLRKRTEELNDLRWRDQQQIQSEREDADDNVVMILNQQLADARAENERLMKKIAVATIDLSDLSLIKGIGDKVAEQLASAGIGSLQDIAALNLDEIEDEDHALHSFLNRIVKDDWIEQALALTS